MKKSTKYIFYSLVLIVAVVLFGVFFLGGRAQKVETSEFWEKAGFIFISDKDDLVLDSSGKTVTVNGENKPVYRYKNKSYVLAVNMSADGFVVALPVTNVGGNDYVGDFDIKKIEVNTYNLIGYNAKGGVVCKCSYSRSELSEKYLQAFMSVKDCKVDYSDPNAGSIWSSLVMPLITVGIGILILVIFMRQAQGGGKSAMDFGKTKARVNSNIKVRFADVAGAEEEKQELQEVVEFLKNPKKFSSLGARIPKGVLLVGPPGTGKTLFAKAVAGEANVPFFSISGSDFVEMFVGVGASRVRDLFAMAKKSMPCIVFIDEIDAVGRQRGAGLGGGNDEREQTLNQLLVQMDGFDSNEGIIIMAATNRADILDPALMRPGRFDRQIYVNLPDVRGREAILKVHARNKPLAANVNFKILARMTAGFSGADLANLLNEAAILAARGDRKAITNADLYEGIEKVLMGPQKKSQLVTESDKRITAYHEAGHAILAKLLPHCDEVHEVTIIPRGRAAGYTLTRPENDNRHMSKNQMTDDIVMTLGGRAAEELIIKDFTTGASNDIKVATNTARAMVTEYGMSDKIGPVNYGSDDQIFVGRDYQTRTNYSEAMAKLIDEEVESIIKKAHEQASELLKANKSVLDVMARVLVERETIYSDEVAMMMKGASVEEIIKYMDENAEVEKNDPFRLRDKELGKAIAEAEKAASDVKTEGEKTSDSGSDSEQKSEESKN